jgi:hypothetical protein
MSSNALSTLELLGEIKLLANQQQEKTLNQAQVLKRKSSSTQELQFALNEIKHTIIDSAVAENENLRTRKQTIEAAKMNELRLTEAQAIEKVQKEAKALALEQQEADQKRAIAQLRLQYQAALAFNPQAPKPQALEAFDAEQASLKKQYEAEIQKAFTDIDLANTAILETQKTSKALVVKPKMLTFALSALFVSMTAAFYLSSSPVQSLENQEHHNIHQPSAGQASIQQPIQQQSSSIAQPLNNTSGAAVSLPSTQDNLLTATHPIEKMGSKLVTQNKSNPKASTKPVIKIKKDLKAEQTTKKLKFQIDQNATDIQDKH